ncbi:nuclear transport factor 2-like protein [Pengzhenrongella sicca]|uniref:Nuclear transport factor 2 family protein n=1 Tax=Pengzhenrongella sicca TaxID=2819238 RepID=A0A8A4ZHY5_9MICO|nr:nuclear transport factor 2 family protein [Pengzhenrongella sicca]QTE31001.1 nuclear transport factor 2 family protein [Pengzhenrongella sicca]
MSNDQELLLKAYAAYNSQNIDGLLAVVGQDVDWPDGPNRLRGKAAVKALVADQWTRTVTVDRPATLVRFRRSLAWTSPWSMSGEAPDRVKHVGSPSRGPASVDRNPSIRKMGACLT